MALARIESGDFAQGVVRMLVALADCRGSVRNDRLQRAADALQHREPMASWSVSERIALINEQTLLMSIAPEAAIAALPRMIRTPQERMQALSLVTYIAGEPDPSDPSDADVRSMLRRFAEILEPPRQLPAASTPHSES
jgi:tellurite resistance protein